MKIAISLNGSEVWTELPDMPSKVVIDFIRRLIEKYDEIAIKRIDK